MQISFAFGRLAGTFIARQFTGSLIKTTLRVMQLTAIIILAACLQVSASGFSQSLTLKFNGSPLSKVLGEIEKKTEYSFIYGKGLIEKAKPVNLDVVAMPVEKIFELIFKDQPLEYRISDNHVIISLEAVKDLHLRQQLAIDPPITGMVLGPDGKPLAGANIIVKGTQKGVSTNVNGSFSIEANTGDVLIISSIGYGPKEIKVKGQSNILVELELSASSLDEVQVIPYGVQVRRFGVGNSSTIKKEQIAQQPVNNLLSALQGTTAGLEITNNSGVPGDGARVRIRGINSINGGAPLVLVDNVPADISSIAPADVESVEVLKDAAATAIYGARGSNGVLLVTTKKGKIGKGKVNLQAYESLTTPTHLAPTLNSEQYFTLREEGYKNDNVSYTPATAPDLFMDRSANTDWSDKLYKQASTQDVQVNFSGGNNDLSYYFSGGLRNENGTIDGPWKSNRYNIRTNIDARISKSIHAGGTMAYTFIKNYTFNSAVAPVIYYALPLIPYKDTEGNINLNAYSPYTNPNRYLTSYNDTRSNQILGNLYIDYKVLSDFDFRTDVNFTNSSSRSVFFSPTTANTVADESNFGTFGNGNGTTINIEPKLTYERSFGIHNIKFLAGGTYLRTNTGNSSMQVSSRTSAIDELNTPSSGTVTGRTYSEEPYRFVSLFGRINYRFNNKYVFEGVLRRDGSSRFGPENKFGSFWSVGGSYIFSEEPFIKQFSGDRFFGKLRITYGSTGTDQIGSFRYVANSPVVSIPYMNQTTIYVGNLSNPGLKWEETKKFDVGIDLNLFNDRINITADYYKANTNGMLYTDFLSMVSGFNSIVRNMPGLVNNTGYEIQLNVVPFKTKELTWNSAFNISFIKNKLVSLPALKNATFAARYVYQEGKPLDLIWALKYKGVNSQTGLAQFEDVDNSGSILTYSPDYQVIGKGLPDFFGGWTNTLTCNNLDFTVFAQFVKGITKGYTFTSGIGQPFNLPAVAINRWQKPGDVTDIPRAAAPGSAAAAINNNIASSDFAYDDASYIRIKNMTVGYTIPAKSKTITNLRVYATALNLFTITKFKGDDPEGGANLVPMTKMYTFGVNATF